MLQIIIPGKDLFDESTNKFVNGKEYVLQLEHSLISLSKWESRWKKPFLSKIPRTDEEALDYIRCMTIAQNIPREAYENLSQENINEVARYIDDTMTATTFAKTDKTITNRDIITAEIIYYWMVLFNIPFECEKWHLNRLLTLINVCSIKNQPAKKMGRKEILANNAALNRARRESYKTGG